MPSQLRSPLPQPFSSTARVRHSRNPCVGSSILPLATSVKARHLLVSRLAGALSFPLRFWLRGTVGGVRFLTESATLPPPATWRQPLSSPSPSWPLSQPFAAAEDGTCLLPSCRSSGSIRRARWPSLGLTIQAAAFERLVLSPNNAWARLDQRSLAQMALSYQPLKPASPTP